MKRIFRLSSHIFQTYISRLSFVFKLRMYVPIINKEARTIIFLGYHLQPRIARLISVINEKYDFQICLLCEKGRIPEIYLADVFLSNIYILEYRNKWEALHILSNLNIHNAVIHSFEPRCTSIAFLHKRRKEFNSPKFVFDIQDLYVNYFGLKPKERWIKKDIKAERYCIENLDGLICHSLEINPASRAYKISPRKKIFFPLYCDKRNFHPVNISSPELPWKVVYAGNITGKKNYKSQQVGQFHDLAKILSDQGVEFHIYPSPNVSHETIVEYEELKKSILNFHLHKSVNQALLSSELAKYHFAIIPFFLEDSSELPVKHKYATTLKLFNYFEAGIPVLVSEDLIFQTWITQRYQLGLGISKDFLKNFPDRIQSINYRSLIQQYDQNRNQLLLQDHIQRIINFYQEI